MKSFGLISGFVIVTAILFAVIGPSPGTRPVLGMPVIGDSDDFDRPAWLQVGGGTGVLVVGIGGAGVVTYGLYGAGVLFATGQAAVGLFAIGQLAFGLVFVICQMGAAMSGVGQGIVGVQVSGQGTLGGDGDAFLTRLNADAERILSFTSR
jgi:hypothetical protein